LGGDPGDGPRGGKGDVRLDAAATSETATGGSAALAVFVLPDPDWASTSASLDCYGSRYILHCRRHPESLYAS